MPLVVVRQFANKYEPMSYSTNKSKERGFTVVELLVASAVFSTVLLVALVGFLQIGKIFYKGVTISQTSQSAKSITESLKADIAYASDLSNLTQPHSSAGTVSVSGGYFTRRFFCAGNVRYTYILGSKVDTSNHNFSSRFGIVRDTLSVPGCPVPTFPIANATEMLGNKTRLSELVINQPASSANFNNLNLYNLGVRVTYGDDDVLQNPTSTSPTCQSGINSSTYCYIYNMQTTVVKGN